MLTCNNISYYQNDLLLFSGLGFTLFPGSIISIKGANGSGKTTLLKVIAGLWQPDSGCVKCEDEDIMKLGDLYKNSVHYVSHKNSIHENLTVLENLQYYAEIVEGQILIPTAIHYMKLDNYLEWPASKLSAGWKRRLSLSRLMLSNRKIWLLDEPAASLDRETSASLGRLITTRADTGGIVIFTSHGELEIPKATEFTMEDFVCLDS